MPVNQRTTIGGLEVQQVHADFYVGEETNLPFEIHWPAACREQRCNIVLHAQALALLNEPPVWQLLVLHPGCFYSNGWCCEQPDQFFPELVAAIASSHARLARGSEEG